MALCNCSVLQCVSAYCSVVQNITVYCSVLQKYIDHGQLFALGGGDGGLWV